MKYISFIIFGLLLINLASAFDWNDNTLVSYYNFDSSSGTKLTDIVQGFNNGTLFNMEDGDWVSGKTNNALKFDGENEFVNFTNPAKLQLSNLSICSWIKAEIWQPLDYVSIIEKNFAYGIMMDKAGTLRIYDWGGGSWRNAGVAILNDTTWHHICFVFESDTSAQFYADGSTDGPSFAYSVSHQNAELTLAGEIPENKHFNGTIDELGIWNRTLTSSEISELYNSGAGLFYDTPTISLTVTLNSPSDVSTISDIGTNFTANYTATDSNLSNATYYIWNESSLFNSTLVWINGTSNYTDVYVDNFTLGDYHWNVWACAINETAHLCEWADSNYTFVIGAIIDNESYPTSTFETKNESFWINISLIEGANLYVANLIYNNTKYLATITDLGSNKYYIQKTIDISLLPTEVKQNTSFYWNLQYLNEMIGEQNTTIRNITINPLIFRTCNATLFDPVVVNYTIYNESTRTSLNATLDGSFTYYLGDGSITKNYTLDSTIDTFNYSFCSNQNETLNIDAIIHLKKGSNERTFYFNDEKYNNITTHIKLFLLDTGSNIIHQVRDAGLSPLSGYFVDVLRFYPDSNLYETVERAKTDIYGQFVAKLVENSVKYKYIFRDADGTIKKTTDDMTIACRSTICILPFVIEDTADDVERFGNLTDYDWSFSFNNNTNTFVYAWNDVSGISATMRLEVKRYLWNGTTTVCDSTSTNPSGTLTCDVGSQSANYIAQAFRKVSGGDERLIAKLTTKVGDESKVFGNEGLIWSFFLLMVMIVLGYWFPPLGVIFYLVGIVFLSVTNIVYINPAILFAQFAIGIAFIWAFKRK